MRGEYRLMPDGFSKVEELPPHARRILMVGTCCFFGCGTTSACAENTAGFVMVWIVLWNYLRMRGEYPARPLKQHLPWELPPHARRIHAVYTYPAGQRGTTSACAENTPAGGDNQANRGNYLRMRGEYHIQKRGDFPVGGTTSACAENTKSCDTPH